MMEKRVLIAIILSLAVLLLWQALFPPPKPEKTTEILPEQQRQDAFLPEKVPPAEEKEQKAEVTPPSIPSSQPDRSSLPPEREIVVTTDLYRATFSSHGACLKRFELLRYKNKQKLPAICFIFPFSLLYGEKQIYQDISYKELIGSDDMEDCPLRPLLRVRMAYLSQPYLQRM